MSYFHIYDVELKYIRNLQKADDNVMSQSPQINKDTRRYLGIIVMVNEQQYCIPFSSGQKSKYQKKNNNLDLIKIPDLEKKTKDGSNPVLSVLNINNMIPVNDLVITKVDLSISKNDSIDTRQRKGILRKELNWCRDNSDLIERRAKKVYSLVTETPEKSRNLTRRCCDFKKLENVLEKYLDKKEPNLLVQSDTRQHNKKNERVLYNREKGRKAAQQIRKDSINDTKNKGKNNPIL